MANRKKKKILIAFGTRPEAIKFVPLIHSLRKSPDFDCYVCLTGQHREMVNQVIRFFDIKIDKDLNLMVANQSLEYVSGRVISKFGKVVRGYDPDLLFVQGDTATALMVAISSFYNRVSIAHLEAGLRTWDKYHPFPEEMNRTLITHLADYHFTPTGMATRNLVKEGVRRNQIIQSGNTVVDSVEIAKRLLSQRYPVFRGIDFKKKIIMMTAHRRESFGSGLHDVFHALRRIAYDEPNVEIVYPVHLNPKVLRPARKILSNLKNVHLLRPLTYEEACWLLSKSYLVLTDSGGIQEEAPSFKKPVLVLRNVTERPEGIRKGIAKLVGTDQKRIVRLTKRLLHSPNAYRQMIAKHNPYGDGQSAKEILKSLRKILNKTYH